MLGTPLSTRTGSSVCISETAQVTDVVTTDMGCKCEVVYVLYRMATAQITPNHD